MSHSSLHRQLVHLLHVDGVFGIEVRGQDLAFHNQTRLFGNTDRDQLFFRSPHCRHAIVDATATSSSSRASGSQYMRSRLTPERSSLLVFAVSPECGKDSFQFGRISISCTDFIVAIHYRICRSDDTSPKLSRRGKILDHIPRSSKPQENSHGLVRQRFAFGADHRKATHPMGIFTSAGNICPHLPRSAN